MAVQVVPFLGILAASDSAAARPTLGLPVFRLSSIVGQALPGALGGPLGYELDLSRAIAGGGSFLSRSEGFLGVIALISIAAAWRRLAPTFRRGAIVGAAAMVVAWCPPGVSWIWRRLPLLGLAGEHYAYVVWAIFGAAAAGPALALLAEEAQPRRLGAALAGGGILLAAAGLAPVVAGEEALRKTALGAVERMRARGTLRNPTAVYAARLATYLKSGRATAVRRLAVPGILWAAGGLLLASRRPRGALPWIAVGELFASSAGYYPAMRKSDAPPLPAAIADVAARDPDRQFLLAAGSGIYPPNLATMVPLRDLRRFDEIEPVGAMASLREAGYRRPDLGFPEPVAAAAARRLARAGVRFVLARSPVETSERVGGDPPPGVGLYELAGAEPRPKPANGPPRGLVSGVILSGAAAVAAFLLAWRSSSRAAI
jgi:hypothetical protein